MRLDGNSILLVDADATYGSRLMAFLEKYGAQCSQSLSLQEAKLLLVDKDFDAVICNYYLPDGLIHQLIDWSQESLQTLPVFAQIGSTHGPDNILRRHQISDVLFKKDFHAVVRNIQRLLFDFVAFKRSLLETREEKGISLEVVANREKTSALAIELNSEGLFLSLEKEYQDGTPAVIHIAIYDKGEIDSFSFNGHLSHDSRQSSFFHINRPYLKSWKTFISTLEKRQLKINTFMKKVAGY